MIYANLLPALQAKAIGATVYILNLIPSNALDRDFLRHVVDVELSRAVNPKKLLLNILRAYSTTAIVYNEAVLRGSKVEARGERGQLVGYKDSVYRIQIASKHKVKRLPYCQFIKEGELAEIPSTVEPDKEDTTQQFEYNLVEPRGKSLVIPNGYTIETVNPDILDEDNESFTQVTEDAIAQDNALKAVVSATEEGGLPEVSYDAEIDNDESLPKYE